MKNVILFLVFCFVAAKSIQAQKWSELSDEQKLMAAKDFRADNQNYLKSTLAMTDQQITDIDNVNVCFLSTLDRINRYSKDNVIKEKYAKAITDARSLQLDAIMGPNKHKQYSEYIKGKLQKQ